MSQLKYIVFSDIDFVIFPVGMTHSNVARSIPVVSAGFLHLKSIDNRIASAHCFGESTSLGIKSNPEKDSRIITGALRNGDW